MGLVDELLGGYQNQTNALMAAATGGMQAPVEGPAQSAGPAPAPAKDPLAVLLQGAMRYERRRGRDPLAARADGMAAYDRGSQPSAAFEQAGAPGVRALMSGVTQSGPRAGQARNSFDLGNGWLANVYFDENGKRQVMKFRKPGMGGGVSP